MCRVRAVYWANNVQGFTDAAVAATYSDSLSKFVESGFDRAASVVDGADFASGTGGIVTNGDWTSTPHENGKRLANFDYIVSELRSAGMVKPPPVAPTCPPAGWDRCSTVWPPLSEGYWSNYCCSSSGYLGKTPAHCEGDGIDARDECCTMEGARLSCEVDCEPAPDDCTGIEEIDAVLAESKIWCKIGLHKLNPVYTWSGFCDAVKAFNNLPGTDRRLNLGNGDASAGLSNLAGLLAQSMWESGGDAPCAHRRAPLLLTSY